MPFRVLTLALLASLLSTAAARADPPRRLLLVGQGPDGHPAKSHEYMAGVRILAKCLQKVPDLEITLVRADGAWKEGPDLIGRSDAIVLYLSEGARWLSADPARRTAFEQAAARGCGLTALHWAMGTREAGPIAAFLPLFGACHGGPDRKYKLFKTEVRPAHPEHPILTGLAPFTADDEFYYALKTIQAAPGIIPLLQVSIDGRDQTIGWAWERKDSGRSFGFTGLHYHANWALPEYRKFISQGVLWTLKLPVPQPDLPAPIRAEDLRLP